MVHKKEINKSDPKESGVYVAYVEHQFLDKYPDKELLMWHDGYWSHRMSDQKYRGKVYGWIGPLPSPTMEDLVGEIVKYAIGTLPDGLNGAFINGPFNNIKDAEEIIGNNGQYIIELHLDSDCIPIRKWSDRKMKWLNKKTK